MSYGYRDRHSDNARHQTPQDRGHIDINTTVLNASNITNCKCGVGIRYGAIVLDGVEFCSRYRLHVPGKFNSRTNPGVLIYNSGVWRTEEMVTNLLPPPSEGEATPQTYVYELSFTSGSLHGVGTPVAVLQLLRVDGGMSVIAEWRSYLWINPRYGFECRTTKWVNPGLRMDFSAGCMVCVMPQLDPQGLDPCMDMQEVVVVDEAMPMYTGELPPAYRTKLTMAEEYYEYGLVGSDAGVVTFEVSQFIGDLLDPVLLASGAQNGEYHSGSEINGVDTGETYLLTGLPVLASFDLTCTLKFCDTSALGQLVISVSVSLDGWIGVPTTRAFIRRYTLHTSGPLNDLPPSASGLYPIDVSDSVDFAAIDGEYLGKSDAWPSSISLNPAF